MIHLGRAQYFLALVLLIILPTDAFQTKPLQPCSYVKRMYWIAPNRILYPHQSYSLLSLNSVQNGEDEQISLPNNQNVLTESQLKQKNLIISYISLAVLTLVYASNQWCRQALYYLCDFSVFADPFKHINAAIDFTKDEYAFLSAVIFTGIFTLFSLIAGNISDNFNRRNIVALSCIVWSIATAMQYTATSYQDLAIDRLLVGASQAFFNPAAYTLISDLFPPQLVATMNGIFSGGIFVGGALASLSIYLNQMLGWRDTLGIIGVLGVVMGVVSWFGVVDPREKKVESLILNDITSPTSMATNKRSTGLLTGGIDAVKEVLQSTDSKILYLASACRFTAGLTIVVWKAPLMFERFPESESLFAGSNAFIVAVGGLLSSVLGGIIADKLANPSLGVRKISRSWVSAIGSLIAGPMWAGFILADNPLLAIAFLFGEYLAAECWFGPTLATLFDIVPAHRRGVAQGLFSILIAIGNIGPMAVASIAKNHWFGDLSLSDILLYLVCFSYITTASLFALLAIRQDKKIREES
jgi:MFS family permease